jgi:hypothetical protein
VNISSLYKNPHEVGCFWHSAAANFGSPNIDWCEQTLCQIIAEPANTWSNLSYILVGLFLLKFRKSSSPGLNLFPKFVIFLGLCSFVYHLSIFYITQIFDFLGMFLCSLWGVGMNLIRLKKLQKKYLLRFIFVGSAIMTLGLHVMWLHHIKFQQMIIFILIALLITEYKAQKRSQSPLKNLYWNLGLTVIAFGFSLLDHHRILCFPYSWFQGHALWHILSGLSLYFIHAHYVLIEKDMG